MRGKGGEKADGASIGLYDAETEEVRGKDDSRMDLADDAWRKLEVLHRM